jgi:hypothetical protein
MADIFGGLFLGYFFREIQQMALPTPGYNPETSLLQGGTAPILPVQGGGSLAGAGPAIPPSNDYNPSASLLQGGTGVIEPIRGGGKTVVPTITTERGGGKTVVPTITTERGGGKEGVRFASTLEEERTYSKNAPPKNVSRASRAYTLEVYNIVVEPSPLAVDPDLNARQRRLMAYVAKEKTVPLLTSIGTVAADGGAPITEFPKYDDCKRSLPANYFVERPRKVHFMDDKPHILWLIPNLRGNKEVFETFFEKIVTLQDGKSLLPGKEHAVVFTGAFYPDTPNQTSVFLFDEIMKLKRDNPGQVYVISPGNATLLRNGCYILDNTYATKGTLGKFDGKSKEVPTFFEPDVLVFPYEQILIRSSDMPISADSSVSIGALLEKKVYTKSFYIKAAPGRKADPKGKSLENYVTVLSNPSQAETRSWPPKPQQTIKCPKGMDCWNFEVGFPLSLLGPSIVLNFLETKLYLFHITADKDPFFTGPKEGVTGAEEEEEEEEEEEVDLVSVDDEEEEKPPVVPAKVSRPKKITGVYKESAEAKSSKKTVTFDLAEYRFTIRVPDSYVQRDPIRVDWLNEIFTKDEALLLNALQLTPKLMQKAFGDMYKWRLSNFLGSLTYSSCFKESRLLLKSECEDARRFLRKVGFLLEKDCLEAFYTNLGTPPKGEIEVVPEVVKEEPKRFQHILNTVRSSLQSLSLDDSSPSLFSAPGKGGLLLIQGNPVRCDIGGTKFGNNGKLEEVIRTGIAEAFKDKDGVRYVYFQDETGKFWEMPAHRCTQLSIVPELEAVTAGLNALSLGEEFAARDARLSALLSNLGTLTVE